MMKVPLLISFSILCALLPLSVFAQGEQKPPAGFRVYDSSGKVVTLDEVVAAMSTAEVVFIGETHNDAVAHRVELQLVEAATARYGAQASSARREVTLSLEMFERDVQTTLDEYLGSLILEKQLLSDSRPWNNYQTDYRPLIEFARANSLPVIAANVPTRYANRVSRMGRGALAALSPQAKAWISPLPYGEASAAYAAKFNRAMEGMGGGHGVKQNFLDAQVLRDATMAYAISQALSLRPKALVLHVTGLFHVEGRMGIPEQLEKYRPRTRSLVITLVPERDAPRLDPENLKKAGDFVIVTGVSTALIQ
ncbi:MAG TPA: ChaN family lipoprotein [Pyrinomonadaceae bacterium]|nr:ChaN family lipoprotein [Pyrinomonadaceae bacterium]